MGRVSTKTSLLTLTFLVLSWTLAGCTLDISVLSDPLTKDLPSVSEPVIDGPDSGTEMPSAAFGISGMVRTNMSRDLAGGASDSAQSAAVQSDGKIVVVGTSEDSAPIDFSVHRYEANGSLDTSFGDNGVVVTDMNSGSYDYAEAVVIQGDGKIIAVGRSTLSGISRFALARYNTNGSLDTSFGGTGKVFAGIDGITVQAMDVALQSDGKIVAVGNTFTAGTTDFAVFRFNTDGSLDTSFGGTGKVRTDTGSNDTARSVAIQSDGKIVVGGFSGISGNNDFAVFRYNTDGSLDSSFGSAGMAFVNISGTNTDIGDSLGLQSDGKIVMVGWHLVGIQIYLAIIRLDSDGVLDTTYGASGKVTLDITAAYWDQGVELVVQSDNKVVVASSSYVGGYEFVTLRFNTNGSLDTSFGTTGKVVTGFAGGSRDVGYGVILDANQKILAIGSTDLSGDSDFALLKQNTDGSLDTSFGTNGKSYGGSSSYSYSTDQAYATALQEDGKLLVAGSSYGSASTDFALVRYNIDGSLDSTFGTEGKILTDLDGGSHDYPYAIALQDDGKIVLAGYTSGTYNRFALVRYQANGSLDTTFGTAGIVITQFGANSADFANAVAVQEDGKILVVGTSDVGISTDVVLVRYLSDGSLDSSFGTGGKVFTDAGFTNAETASKVVLQSDGKILVSGASYTGSSDDFMVIRYTTTGALDPSFGVAGIALIDVDSNQNDYLTDIKVQADGSLVLLGNHSASASDDIALVRLTSSGSLDTSFGNSGKVIFGFAGDTSDYARALIVNSVGQIYVGGDTNPSGLYDFTILNFNPDGSLNTSFGGGAGWVVTDISASSSDRLYGMALHTNGSLFAAGRTSLLADDFVVIKYNSDGTR